jgi:hypothetical protein
VDGVDQDIRIAVLRLDPASLKELLSHFKKQDSGPVLIEEELRLNVHAKARSRMLLQREMNTSLSLNETGQKPKLLLLARQAFLLIVCTVQIFTAACLHMQTIRRVSDGYSEFPAYSHILQRP